MRIVVGAGCAPGGKTKPLVALTPVTQSRVEHTDRRAGWVRATLAFACTFVRIQRGVGGRDRIHNFGDAKRDANTYT